MQGPSDFEITRRDLLKVGAVSVAVSTVPLRRNRRAERARRDCTPAAPSLKVALADGAKRRAQAPVLRPMSSGTSRLDQQISTTPT